MPTSENFNGDRIEESQGACDSRSGACAEEVKRAEWPSFFQAVSEQHRGDRVTVEVRGNATEGAGELASQMPLQGITPDIRQVGQKMQLQLEVILGGGGEGHITHLIANPQRVWRQLEGDHEMLQIIDSSGVTTAIHLPA